jgi:hypothetical protein
LTPVSAAVSSAAMNAIFRALACVLIGAGLAAAEPPATNRVVVLDNENLLEGEVTRTDAGYEIKRPVGGDVTLPAKRVLAVVADRKAAFAIVAERANRRDADERLRLAKWCMGYGLLDEALAEAQAAVRMRDRFTAAEQMLRSLESMVKLKATTPDSPPIRIEPAAKDTVTDVPAIEYNSESYPIFASRVNAILMNACASCHSREDVKAFKLTRLGGRSGMTKNLMAALAQVNPGDPAASPLMVKAATAHGSATEAPFKTKSHPAYRNLETWARFARAPEGTAAPEESFASSHPTEIRKQADPLADKPTPPTLPGSGDSFGQESKSTPPKPVKTQADDEFDPAIFNGEVKPKK